jgi:prepilin-type N-terminal cleavage/methylation domain-containing protein
MKIHLQHKGFTLVETLVVIGIFTVVSLAITESIYSLYQSNAYTFAQSNEVDNARRGINRFARDIREMTYAEDGAFPMVEMGEHQLSFYSDIDKDNSVEYVEYELSTTTLTKRVYNATGNPPVYSPTPNETYILSEYVQNITEATSTFFYYDDAGNQLFSTSPLTDVRYVEAQVIVNIDPVRAPGEFVLRMGVAPRNLKDNL